MLRLLSKTNNYVDPKVNKKLKMLNALSSWNKSYTNLGYHRLEDVPIKMMPRVLYSLQGEGVMDQTEYNRLNALFELLREWNMPLLYASQLVPEVRSERIRRKKVFEHLSRWFW